MAAQPKKTGPKKMADLVHRKLIAPPRNLETVSDIQLERVIQAYDRVLCK
jgi:hypothetical protein